MTVDRKTIAYILWCTEALTTMYYYNIIIYYNNIIATCRPNIQYNYTFVNTAIAVVAIN